MCAFTCEWRKMITFSICPSVCYVLSSHTALPSRWGLRCVPWLNISPTHQVTRYATRRPPKAVLTLSNHIHPIRGERWIRKVKRWGWEHPKMYPPDYILALWSYPRPALAIDHYDSDVDDNEYWTHRANIKIYHWVAFSLFYALQRRTSRWWCMVMVVMMLANTLLKSMSSPPPQVLIRWRLLPLFPRPLWHWTIRRFFWQSFHK